LWSTGERQRTPKQAGVEVSNTIPLAGGKKETGRGSWGVKQTWIVPPPHTKTSFLWRGGNGEEYPKSVETLKGRSTGRVTEGGRVPPHPRTRKKVVLLSVCQIPKNNPTGGVRGKERGNKDSSRGGGVIGVLGPCEEKKKNLRIKSQGVIGVRKGGTSFQFP